MSWLQVVVGEAVADLRRTWPHLNVAALDEVQVRVSCEWMCPKCLTFFVEQMSSRLPWVEGVEIGDGAREKAGLRDRFIKIESRAVAFEDGSSVVVEPFEISQLPVSIAAFARFVETTGYVPTAEKNADSESFRHNFP